jgi:hypothetical protein
MFSSSLRWSLVAGRWSLVSGRLPIGLVAVRPGVLYYAYKSTDGGTSTFWAGSFDMRVRSSVNLNTPQSA